MHEWHHGFWVEWEGGGGYWPNALTSAGIDRALRLWAGQNVPAWDAIRLKDSGGSVIAKGDTSNSIESSQLRAVATFAKDEVTAAVATVELMAGSVIVASASLAAPADAALTVTRVDSLVEAP